MSSKFPPAWAHRAVEIAILGLIALVYWPVIHGGLVWDDKFYLHDRAWLRHGHEWLRIALHGFPDWQIYFRPLGVAALTAQVRLFDAAAAPMHVVSLGLHLFNALCVARLVATLQTTPNPWPARGAMLLYGLHPTLIEPVAWISSQFDLLATSFSLLGLLANARIARGSARVALTCACFVAAAGSKEAGLAFPILLVLYDWIHAPEDAWRVRLIGLLRRQWPLYAALTIASFVYLLLRLYGLGSAFGAHYDDSSLGYRLQLVCYTYLSYLRLIVWPFADLAPLHDFAVTRFAQLTAASACIDAAALALGLGGVYWWWRRNAVGAAICSMTAALLPVLHILPVSFSDGLYSERYATLAIALVCVYLGAGLGRIQTARTHRRPVLLCAALFAALWSAIAIPNIRVTLPLWADEVRLWRWNLRQNPGSVLAQDTLLSTYVEIGNYDEARPLADALFESGKSCIKCMLNVAFLAIAQRDPERAMAALALVAPRMNDTAVARSLRIGYLLATANLAEQRNRPQDAVQAYRAAIALDPLSPEAYMDLALFQLRQHDADAAQAALRSALSLSAPDDRAARQRRFEAAASAVLR